MRSPRSRRRRLAGTSAAGMAFSTGSSARAIWPGAGRRPRLPPSGPSARMNVSFPPPPYGRAASGHWALVAWFDRLWSVGPDGVTEWGLRLQDLSDPQVIEVRLRGQQTTAAAALGLSAQASHQE